MSYKGAVASAPRELVSFRMSVFFPIPQLYFLKANLVGFSGERNWRERERGMMGFYLFSRRRSSSSSLLYLLYHSFQDPFFYFLSEVIRVVGWWGFLQAYRIEFDTHSVGSWVWWQEIEGCIHMECWWCKPNLLHFPFTSSSIFFELLKLLPCWRNSILPFSWSCWMSFHAAAFIEVLLFGIERPWLSLPNFIDWTLLLLLGNLRSWQWDHSIL